MKTTARKSAILRPPFKCHGGKAYLKKWVIDNFPSDYEDMTYVEPYSGAASVLLNKEPSKEEAMNDLHPGVIEIFKAIRDDHVEFAKRLKKLSYSQRTFDRALKQSVGPLDGHLDLAVNEYVLRRMSRGGMKKAFAWSERLRGGQPGDVNAWKTALKLMPDLSERLQSVYIFNKPAVEVIKAFNKHNTLLYVDPPYLHSTRKAKKVYEKYEMTEDDHKKLCEVLVTFKGKVLISGYDSELYDSYFQNWHKIFRDIANHSSQSKKKEFKREVLWMNFVK
jgi:DNA adenine methylase